MLKVGVKIHNLIGKNHGILHLSKLIILINQLNILNPKSQILHFSYGQMTFQILAKHNFPLPIKK